MIDNTQFLCFARVVYFYKKATCWIIPNTKRKEIPIQNLFSSVKIFFGFTFPLQEPRRKEGSFLLLILEFVIAPIVVGITLQYSSHLLDEFFELRKT